MRVLDHIQNQNDDSFVLLKLQKLVKQQEKLLKGK